MTEHSFRRTGAKFYASRGVSEPHICFLGRWGSAVVRMYIEEAMGAQAVEAARIATAGAWWNPMAQGSLSEKGVSQAELLVQAAGASQEEDGAQASEEILKAAARIAEETVSRALEGFEARWAAAVDLRNGAVRLAGQGDQVRTHRVLIGDGTLPTTVWVTSCGWRFGSKAHFRTATSEVSCVNCLRWSAPP